MKTFLLTLVLVGSMVGCGKAGSSGAAGTAPAPVNPGPGAPTEKVFQLRITGDNVQFARSSVVANSGQPTEHQYPSEGPVTIPASTQYTLDMTGFTLSNISVQRMAGPANNLVIQIWKNGQLSQTATLTTNGTFNNFNNE